MMMRRLARGILLALLRQDILPDLQIRQWSSASSIAAEQVEKGQQLVIEAYKRFPSYRNAIHAAGLTLSALEKRAFAWREIPTLRRSEIGHWPEFAQQRRRYAWRVTGGTGSRPALRIPMNRQVYCWYTAGTWRGLQWWGVEMGDRAVVLLPSGGAGVLRMLARTTKDSMLNWLRLPADDRFETTLKSILSRIAHDHPQFIYGYPSTLASLGAWMIHHDAHVIKPRVVVATGEHLYGFQRRVIQEAFGCPVAEEYGSSEFGCIAFQCPQGNLHVTAESVMLEVPGDPGSTKSGRVLVTGLRNQLIPLIRYEIGDTGVLDKEQCPCGRGLPVVRIVGRLEEKLEMNGSFTSAQEFIEQTMAHFADRVANARLVKRSRFELVLEVVTVDGRRVDTSRIKDAATDRGYRVEVHCVPSIPRTALGKVSPLDTVWLS